MFRVYCESVMQSPVVLLCSLLLCAYSYKLDKPAKSSPNDSSDWEELLAMQHSDATRDQKMSEFIQQHNEAFEKGLHSFKLRENHLTKLTRSEYQKLLGNRPSNNDDDDDVIVFRPPYNVKIPDEVDWREHGLVTHVKDQEQCGSCYAFAATGALEGQHARATGFLAPLSEQNILDCDYSDHGCHGGLATRVFDYVRRNGGIDAEWFYKYKGKEEKCHFNRTFVGATDSGFVRIPPGDEELLKAAVATVGPIAISFDARSILFKAYGGGVYYNPNCTTFALDHAMLIVGYGTDPEHGDYWLVKNSWATDYGEDGYIRTARNKQNHCGIATNAAFPLV